MSQIKGVLFDKDGTLLNLNDTWLSIWHLVEVYLMEQHRLSKDTMKAIKQALGILEDTIVDGVYLYGTMEEWLEIVVLYGDLDKEVVTMDISIMVSNYFDSLTTYPLIGDVKGTLQQIKEKGIVIGLVTNDYETHAWDFIHKSGLIDLFDYVVGDDLSRPLKPDPITALSFCEQFGLKPSEVMMVGDSFNDFNYAKHANLGYYLGINQKDVIAIESIEEVLHYL